MPFRFTFSLALLGVFAISSLACKPESGVTDGGETTKPMSPSPVPPAPSLSLIEGNPVCLSALTPPSDKQWAQPPAMAIDADRLYMAVVHLKKGGSFAIKLHAKEAPQTVNSFVFLARNGFFDGLTFHRVLEGFMAQGGDPLGSGMGSAGYRFAYEPTPFNFDKPGVIAMANAGPRTPTNGSQFFITYGPCHYLDGGYTIFGQVVQGMEHVDGLKRRDPQENPSYQGDAIERVEIWVK